MTTRRACRRAGVVRNQEPTERRRISAVTALRTSSSRRTGRTKNIRLLCHLVPTVLALDCPTSPICCRFSLFRLEPRLCYTGCPASIGKYFTDVSSTDALSFLIESSARRINLINLLFILLLIIYHNYLLSLERIRFSVVIFLNFIYIYLKKLNFECMIVFTNLLIYC